MNTLNDFIEKKVIDYKQHVPLNDVAIEFFLRSALRECANKTVVALLPNGETPSVQLLFANRRDAWLGTIDNTEDKKPNVISTSKQDVKQEGRMTDTPRIKRFEEYEAMAARSELPWGVLSPEVQNHLIAKWMLDDLAEHVEWLEWRIKELTKTDQDRFVEDVKKTTEYLKDTIKPIKE